MNDGRWLCEHDRDGVCVCVCVLSECVCVCVYVDVLYATRRTYAVHIIISVHNVVINRLSFECANKWRFNVDKYSLRVCKIRHGIHGTTQATIRRSSEPTLLQRTTGNPKARKYIWAQPLKCLI